MSVDDVVVIGAGPAGLAVSASLRRAGVSHLVVERASSVGASWRQHYDRLHLHTTARHSSLPFSRWPPDTPRYPSRADVVAYLERYATEHHIAPRFGVEVTRISRGPTRFVVETNDGQLTPRFVVVATGENAIPRAAELPGLASFAGQMIHSAAYKNPAPFAGQRTLVVGCGNSGAEIALDLAEQGVDAAMVVRGPVHVVPRDLVGVPIQDVAVLLSPLPIGPRDAIVSSVLRLAVGDLSRWGIRRPSVGVNRLIDETGRLPILDVGTIAFVKAGRIRVLPAIDEIRHDHVQFVDGQVHTFDAIILATGYRTGLERLVDGFDTIADSQGRPARSGAEVAIPGLFFVGFRPSSTGVLRQISIEAPRVAAAIRDGVAL